MVGQSLPEVGQAVGVKGLDRLRDATMQMRAAPGRHPGVGDLAHPLVREAEPLADRGEDSPADELLHALRRRLVVELAGVTQQREVELAPDQRGHREQ